MEWKRKELSISKLEALCLFSNSSVQLRMPSETFFSAYYLDADPGQQGK
jgi:hypothetical protein